MAVRKHSVKIEQIMTSNAVTVNSSTAVRDAAEMMKNLDIGALPVQDDGALKGMLTDRDITVRMVAEGRDPAATKVGEIMTPQTVTCSPEDEVKAVEKKMEQRKVRRVIVVDAEGRAAGIVSLGDVAVHLGKQEGGEVLEKVSEPVHSQAK